MEYMDHPLRIACVVSPLHDMLTANIVEGLEELGHNVHKFVTWEDVEKNSYGLPFHLVLEFSNRHVDSTIAPRLLQKDNTIIYINGEDFRDDHPYNIEWKCFRTPDKYPLYFRRELYTYSPRESHEYPLPFGVYPKYLEYSTDKKSGIIFPSSGEYPNRREIIRYLQESELNVSIGRKGNFRHSITAHASDDYYKYINSAEVIISALGWGEDTARFWESIVTGACVISERFHLDMDHPFEDGKHVLFFDHPVELIEILKKINNGEIDIKKIGQAGKEHAIKHHMIKNRAEYVLRKAYEYNLVS